MVCLEQWERSPFTARISYYGVCLSTAARAIDGYGIPLSGYDVWGFYV